MIGENEANVHVEDIPADSTEENKTEEVNPENSKAAQDGFSEERSEQQGDNEEKKTVEQQASESKEESAGDDSADEEDEELQVKYMRMMADFQNFRRRTEKERSEIYARANENLATELLEVLDNFERALADDSAGGDEGFRRGMELIYGQFKDVLARSGVEEIEADGAEFDPNFHNAVMMEDTDSVESGKISEVLQKGYTLNGRVIRPAMVKVAN